MKTSIHPKYYKKAQITCACGAKFELGSTEELTKVEICAKCHPFFTGKEKLIDTAGRVDKFKARMEAAKKFKKEEKAEKKIEKKKEIIKSEIEKKEK